MAAAGLESRMELEPFDSIINMFPNTPDVLRKKIVKSRPGRLLQNFFSNERIASIGMWWLKKKRTPGRLYSFLAAKRRTAQGC